MAINSFYGIKLGQSQTFTPDGVRIPVTEISAAPLTVIQVKDADHDGYVALKVGFGERKAKNMKKPVLGEFKRIDELTNRRIKKDETKSEELKDNNEKKEIEEQKTAIEQWNNGTMYPKYLREIRIKDSESLKNIKVGDKLNVADIFKEGDVLNVSGITIGKGFQGVVKRHGFAGGPRTHGQSDRERAPGSIGQTTTPGRVYKGKRMAGRMGGEQATVKNLKVVKVDNTRNVVYVKGLVPGKRQGVVKLYK